MSLNCGAAFVKYLLCFFNFLLFISGGALLAVSIWVAIDNTSFFLLTRITDNANLKDHNEISPLETGAYILIVAGALLFLLGFLGCCGAIMESKGLLATYGVLVIVVFLLEITAGVLVAVFKEEVENHMQSCMEKSLRTQYSNKDSPNAITVTWDALMTKLECCGVSNYTDFEYSSRWQENITFNQVIPRACCVPLKGGKELQEGVKVESSGISTFALVDENCLSYPTENNSYYLTGCLTQIYATAFYYLLTCVSVAIGVGGLQLISITITFYLFRAIYRMEKVVMND